MPSVTLKGAFISLVPSFLRPYWDRLEASPLGYRLAKGAFWSLAGTLISRALSLLSSVLVARMLGKVGFGEFGILQSTTGMLSTFAGFGMGLTATKYVAEFRTRDPAKAGRIIRLSRLIAWGSGGAMALGLVLAAPWLARHVLSAPELTGLLRTSSLLLMMSVATGAQAGALSGFEAFKSLARINAIAGIASFPLMVAGAWRFGLDGVIWGSIATQAVNLALNSLALREQARDAGVPLGHSSSAEEWSLVWKFSVPALLSSVMVGPLTWLCNTLLINRPGGYAEMGLFNAANQWFGALMFLPGIMGQTALPVLSESLGQKDSAKAARVLWFYIKVNAAIVVPLVLLGSLASPYIMGSYGRGFAEGWPTLIVILVTAGMLAVQSIVGEVLAASGQLWLGTVMNLGWGLLFLGFTWLLVGHGALGLAWARLLAYVGHGFWTFGFAIYFLRKSRQAEAAPPKNL